MPAPADPQAMSVRQVVAANLARLRAARSWTFVQLKERLQAIGGALSTATLSRLEQAERKA